MACPRCQSQHCLLLPPFLHNIQCFFPAPRQLCLRWPCWLVVAVNRPEPIPQREHLCAMTKAESTSPASRLAAEGCREGGEDLSALKQVAVAGRWCWMAWISSWPVVRQTVGCFLGGARAGGTRAEPIWAGCRCPFHLGTVVLGFFTAWKLLVCEFLLLFLSPGILTGARGCLQPVLSTHTSATVVKERQDWVSCVHSYPQLQGDKKFRGSCSADGDAQGCGSTFGDCPKSRGSGQGLGVGTAWGHLSMAQSLLWCGRRHWRAQGSAGCDSRAVPGVPQRVAVAQPVAGRGRALQELLPNPTGALEIHLFSRAVCP